MRVAQPLQSAKETVMNRILGLCLLAALTISAFAQERSAAGSWTGGIGMPGADLLVIVQLREKDDHSWSGTIDIPMQNMQGLNLTSIKVDGPSISFAVAGIADEPSFKGTLSADGNTISGDFIQGKFTVPFKLKRS
jgi:hypothetical protein